MVMPPAVAAVRSSGVSVAGPTIEPPFLGTRVVGRVFPGEFVGYIDESELFESRWHLSPAGASRSSFLMSARDTLGEHLAAARKQELFAPRVVYGYFPANSEGDAMIIWDETGTSERARIPFRRQAGPPHLCVADYVAPVGRPDFVAIQMVTMGNRLARREADRYRGTTRDNYVQLYGLGIVMRNALTEYWHRRIRIEWGFWQEDGPSLNLIFRQFYRGGRYPIPGNERVVADLLGAEQIGVIVAGDGDESFQPDLTTVRIIVHHPQAGGFVLD